VAGSDRYARMRPDCAEAETGLRGSPVTRRGGDLDHVVVSRKPTELNRQSALGRHLAREALPQSRARSARRWLTAWRLTASALWFVLVGTCSRPPRHQAGRPQGPRNQDLRRQHLVWYRGLVSLAAADWFGPRQVDWIKRLDPEVHNLREALDFALSYSPDVALEMVATLHWYGDARGVLNEHRHWIERALTATPSEPTPDRIRALHAIAVIAGGQGDMPTAGARAAEAVQLAEQVADPVARGPRMDRRHEEPTPSRRGADCGRGETRSPDGSFARRTARFGCLSTRMRTAHARRPWC
jgi:hypothetical protein